jgi:Zn-dependent peptidase ImmA (M78 family)/transcriptional regulator with XRE-family HTH domain
MAKTTEVPVTPAVLEWAMKESGYKPGEVATKVGVDAKTLQAWLAGERMPGMTEFRKLATLLKRTPSTLLLPAPPLRPAPVVAFRRSGDADRQALTPTELRFLREAKRIQRLVGWLKEQLNEDTSPLPTLTTSTSPEAAATAVAHLFPHPGDDDGVNTPSQAYRWWRTLLERNGILVFGFPLGKTSVQGFSIPPESPPVIAVNTWWRSQARSFTAFHELGHLLTGTASACLSAGAHFSQPSDSVERWSDRFSASVLLPRTRVEYFLRHTLRRSTNTEIRTLEVPARIAARFRVSLRAATLRLIEMGLADWPLYEQISRGSEAKPKGGGGGGLERGELREVQYGTRTLDVFLRGLSKDLLGRTDVLDALNISDSDLSKLERRSARAT